MSARARSRLGWGLVALVLAAIVFGSLGSSSERREASRASVDEGASGFSAWVALLEEAGVEVVRRTSPPSAGDLDPGATMVALDTGPLTEADGRALQTFVARGGRVVAGGEMPSATVEAIADAAPRRFAPDASAPQRPLVPALETRGVRAVSAAGPFRWKSAGPALPVLGDGSGPLLISRGLGDEGGEVALLADSSALTNAQLDRDSNALFAVNLAIADDRRRVEFVEVVDAGVLSGDEGFGALPDSWAWGFAGLVLAGLVLVASRLRRLGPPVEEPTAGGAARIGYVDSMASLLARSGSLGSATDPVRRAARQRIAERAGIPDSGGGDMLAEQARRIGIPADEAAALTAEGDDPEASIKAGRALSRVWRKAR